MVALLLGAATTSFAQKANLENPFSFEGAMNLAGGGVTWEAPSVRARYFVNDNIAVRATLGLGDGLGTPRSESYTYTDTSGTGSSEITRLAWNASIGAEYHLDGTDRLSPYFSAAIGFGGGSYDEEWTNANGDAGIYVDGLSATRDGGYSMFGFQIGAGLDIYLIDNLYCGVELGIGFSSMSFDPTNQTVTTPAGTETSILQEANSMSFIGTGAGNASIRFGWRF